VFTFARASRRGRLLLCEFGWSRLFAREEFDEIYCLIRIVDKQFQDSWKKADTQLKVEDLV